MPSLPLSTIGTYSYNFRQFLITHAYSYFHTASMYRLYTHTSTLCPCTCRNLPVVRKMHVNCYACLSPALSKHSSKICFVSCFSPYIKGMTCPYSTHTQIIHVYIYHVSLQLQVCACNKITVLRCGQLLGNCKKCSLFSLLLAVSAP